MAKQKPLFNLTYSVYSQTELDHLINAAKSLDCSFEELIGIALNEYLHNHGMDR